LHVGVRNLSQDGPGRLHGGQDREALRRVAAVGLEVLLQQGVEELATGGRELTLFFEDLAERSGLTRIAHRATLGIAIS
jgi:hypothetical protein